MFLISGVGTLNMRVHEVNKGKMMSRTIGRRCKRCSPPFGIVLVVIEVMDKALMLLVQLKINRVYRVMWKQNKVKLGWWLAASLMLDRRS